MTKPAYTHVIEEWAHITLRLSDGTQLAARAWLPDNASEQPVPAILEYIPYRKRDGTKTRDEQMHPYWASFGYACIRVDMRGCGESEGLMMDEYLQQELDDGVEVINWIAQQDWCTGKVGMMGKSWGGFNCLQVAALQPEPLKAVLTVCSTDDRYADDIHYRGGSLLTENFSWAATMTAIMSKAPDPEILGEQWRDVWLKRLHKMPLLAKNWLQHTYKDDYWKHGSINEDYSQVKAAVYCVGGWGDAYSEAIPRMMQGLPGPKKALIGPWAHKYPHFAAPKPEIDFLAEAKRWWDYWLKGIDNGIMAEPAIAAYLQDSVAPQAHYAERPGIWLEGAQWPLQGHRQSFLLQAGGKLTAAVTANTDSLADHQSVTVASPQTTGAASGEYCVIWCGADFPTDQRADDSYSACFDSEVLTHNINLMGASELEIKVASDQDCGQMIVRLCDVAPDGSSTRVTYGVLNLALRHGLDNPQPVEPGETMSVRIKLDDTGYQIPAGHKIRLAISNAYFPLLWPSAKTTSLQVQLQEAKLTLAVHDGDGPMQRDLGDAYIPEVQEVENLRPASQKRTTLTDAETGRVTTLIEDDFGEDRFLDYDLVMGQICVEEHSVEPYDPHSAISDCTWFTHQQRGDWDLTSKVHLRVTSDADFFYLQAGLTATEAGETVFDKQWQERVDRGTV
ncbi:MAG TPA: peptidase S15 [Oceanospirillaceae bacterium]|nr:peptidase S15 [Oceanospirillaceae bacterium]